MDNAFNFMLIKSYNILKPIDFENLISTFFILNIYMYSNTFLMFHQYKLILDYLSLYVDN